MVNRVLSRFAAGALALWAFSLCSAGSSWAITIDKLDTTQQIAAPNQSVVASSSSIGGFRSVKVTSTSPAGITRIDIAPPNGLGNVDPGLYHSQTPSNMGKSFIVWDGDNIVDTAEPPSKPSGLGGIDLTADNATALRLRITFDFPAATSSDIYVRLYDASDPAGALWSEAKVTLSRAYPLNPADPDEILDIPFINFLAGPGGAASIKKVGAITIKIDGLGAATDITFSFIGTDGECIHVPQNGLIKDECGVCNGDSKSCIDCEGVPNGPAQPGTTCDSSFFGICKNGIYGPFDPVRDCDCVPPPPETEICDGLDNDCDGQIDGVTCFDCKGILNGTAKIDKCGVCDGNGSTCCNEVDITEHQFVLDQGAKKQEAIIVSAAKVLQSLRKDAATKSYINETRAHAHELQIRNWIISWTFPSISAQCQGASQCAEFSNEPLREEYRNHSSQLLDLLKQMIAQVKAARNGKSSRRDKRTLARGERQHAANLKELEFVPKSITKCT